MAEVLILLYDISRNNSTLRKRIWRKLKKSGASLEFRSSWFLQDSGRNLKIFEDIKEEISKFGGKAKIIIGGIK